MKVCDMRALLVKLSQDAYSLRQDILLYKVEKYTQYGSFQRNTEPRLPRY
jgi:hypothetical protein